MIAPLHGTADDSIENDDAVDHLFFAQQPQLAPPPIAPTSSLLPPVPAPYYNVPNPLQQQQAYQQQQPPFQPYASSSSFLGAGFSSNSIIASTAQVNGAESYAYAPSPSGMGAATVQADANDDACPSDALLARASTSPSSTRLSSLNVRSSGGGGGGAVVEKKRVSFGPVTIINITPRCTSETPSMDQGSQPLFDSQQQQQHMFTQVATSFDLGAHSAQQQQQNPLPFHVNQPLLGVVPNGAPSVEGVVVPPFVSTAANTSVVSPSSRADDAALQRSEAVASSPSAAPTHGATSMLAAKFLHFLNDVDEMDVPTASPVAPLSKIDGWDSAISSVSENSAAQSKIESATVQPMTVVNVAEEVLRAKVPSSPPNPPTAPLGEKEGEADGEADHLVPSPSFSAREHEQSFAQFEVYGLGAIEASTVAGARASSTDGEKARKKRRTEKAQSTSASPQMLPAAAPPARAAKGPKPVITAEHSNIRNPWTLSKRPDTSERDALIAVPISAHQSEGGGKGSSGVGGGAAAPHRVQHQESEVEWLLDTADTPHSNVPSTLAMTTAKTAEASVCTDVDEAESPHRVNAKAAAVDDSTKNDDSIGLSAAVCKKEAGRAEARGSAPPPPQGGFAILCDLCHSAEVPDARGSLVCKRPRSPPPEGGEETKEGVSYPPPLNAALLGEDTYIVHVSCALWSPEVFYDAAKCEWAGLCDAIRRGSLIKCAHCRQFGATIGCASRSCQKSFHYHCACGAANSKVVMDHKGIQLRCHKHAAVWRTDLKPSPKPSASAENNVGK